jgi:hypothetical protein
MSVVPKSLGKEKPSFVQERAHPLSADDVDGFLCACLEGCPRSRSLCAPSFPVPPQQTTTRSLCYPNLMIPRPRCGRACRADHSRMIATPPLPTYKHQMAGKSTLNRQPSDYKDQFWGHREAPVVPGEIVGGTSPEPENLCESICDKAEYSLQYPYGERSLTEAPYFVQDIQSPVFHADGTPVNGLNVNPADSVGRNPAAADSVDCTPATADSADFDGRNIASSLGPQSSQPPHPNSPPYLPCQLDAHRRRMGLLRRFMIWIRRGSVKSMHACLHAEMAQVTEILRYMESSIAQTQQAIDHMSTIGPNLPPSSMHSDASRSERFRGANNGIDPREDTPGNLAHSMSEADAVRSNCC